MTNKCDYEYKEFCTHPFCPACGYYCPVAGDYYEICKYREEEHT